MKKFAFLVCAFSLVLTTGNAHENKLNNSSMNNTFINPFANVREVSYVWFTDVDLTNLTGSICTVSAEINRLMRTFPGYVFSPVHYMGLNSFEFGYYPFFTIAIIYSDMTYY